MKKTIIIFLLTALMTTSLFIPVYGEGSQTVDLNGSLFSFRNGITFGMSENEVRQTEEKNGQVDQDNWSSEEVSSWYVIYPKDRIKVSSYEGALMYFFQNDQMEAAAYDIHPDNISTAYETITEAITKVYGESKAIDPATVADLMDCFIQGYYTESDIDSPLLWELDNVCIYQFYYGTDSFVVFYINPDWDYHKSTIEDNETVDITGL